MQEMLTLKEDIQLQMDDLAAALEYMEQEVGAGGLEQAGHMRVL